MGEGFLEDSDLLIITEQLGRSPRGVIEVSYRTPDGVPAVVKTRPRLADGTPFPTLFYLTDPRLVAEASRQESTSVMKKMSQRLQESEVLAQYYRRAHEMYLQERDELECLGTRFSGGGMPNRVKCLHVLMAHALAKGPGYNPFGDESVALAAESGLRGHVISALWPTCDQVQEMYGGCGG